MKIRQGFVSNSSSSSFVAIGLKINKSYDTEELRDIVDKMKMNIYDNSEDGYDDPDFMIIGQQIAEDDDGYMEETETTMSELQDLRIDIEGEIGVEGEVVVFTGSRMC